VLRDGGDSHLPTYQAVRAYLDLHKSSYVTGIDIVVDGGMKVW
jgi:hypothetical protein